MKYQPMMPADPMPCPVCGGRPFVSHDFPPIPIRRFDYAAVCSEFCCDEHTPSGHGATIDEALSEWNSLLEERYS